MLIDYKSVNVYQESLEVLTDVNLQVDKGEFIYIIGKVGSGKSSLLKTMYGELPIRDGEAQVLDFNLKKLRRKRLPRLRKKLGIIFQDFQLLTDRTVESNLRFVLRSTGWKNKHEIKMRIEEVLDMVGMSTKGYKYPNELSGGEQQRIAIARSILNNPEIILADEPTGNLDVETGNNICELLHHISEQGSTVIMVTHNVKLLSLYPARVFQCVDHRFEEITRDDIGSAFERIAADEEKDAEDDKQKRIKEAEAEDAAVIDTTTKGKSEDKIQGNVVKEVSQKSPENHEAKESEE